MIGRLCELAGNLDRMGHHDLSDAIERVMCTAESRPCCQPQIQNLDPSITTMRGPAGWALIQDEERQESESKQVKEKPLHKRRPRRDGVSIGVDVVMDTKRDRRPIDE